MLFFLGAGLFGYLHHQRSLLLERRQSLVEVREDLRRRIARLRSDPAAYEEIARQKYGLIKDHERLIIFE